ncbi:hypothetical protein [Cohnella phaseoli]|uniref:Uncharacterized protein n=1 Tax=Cohnella phaseoli TaxID=456490 RepID=A0A3D9I2L0_9BACL|nr:hypothetical protein [Cohnella phaseoli]RED55891.1 hypothetical protein DFP98_14118 [Cohnella phaseoli]
MRKRTRSDDDLKSMSEYGSIWKALLALQIGLIVVFVYLFFLDFGGSLSSDLQNLLSLNQVRSPLDFFSAALSVPYFYLLLTFLNVLLFQTLNVEDTQRKLKLFFNWDLLFWGGTFLYLGAHVDFMGIPQLAATKKIYPIVIFLLISFCFFYQYARRVGRKYRYIAAGVSALVLICFLFIYSFENNDNWSASTGLLIVLKSLLWVFLAHAFMIFTYLFIGMIASAATNEYRAAQLGKEIQYRRLIVNRWGKFFNKHDIQFKGSLTGKSFSLRVVQDVLKEIVNLKGLTYHERLTLIKKMVRIDASKDLPVVKAKYLQFGNTINVYVSIVFLLNVIVIVLFVLPYIERKEEVLLILLILLSVRLFQRTIGVCRAFLQDVISPKPKSSALTGSERIILAIMSIVETMITSAAIYFLFDLSDKKVVLVKSFQEGYFQYVGQTLWLLLENVVRSIAVSFFNVSLPLGPQEPFSIETIIHLIQVGNSVILITVSIANYLNMKKNSHQYSVSRMNGGFVAYYFLQLPDGKTIKREIARGGSKEKLKQDVKAMWKKRLIDDSELASVIACLDTEKNESESSQAELEKLREMDYGQLDNYLRGMLRDNPHKSNKSIRLERISTAS